MRSCRSERSGARPRALGMTPGKWPKILVVAAATWAVLGAVITLIGWAADMRVLTDWTSDGISMFPNTAACVGLSGLALLLETGSAQPWRRLAEWLAMLV